MVSVFKISPQVLNMGEEQVTKQLLKPKVLVLKPPKVFQLYEEQEVSEKFQFLKAWESPIPTDQYLTNHAHSVQAMLNDGLTLVPGELIRQMPSLRLIVTASTGVNHIDLAECKRRGIAIANAGEIFSEDVADVAVGLLIDVLRRVTAADRYVRRGLWQIKEDYPLGSKLGGKRVGIVGFGSIGRKVAKRLQAFDCKISYNSKNKKPSTPFTFYPNVIDLSSTCDVLVICCALTEQTHHLINKEVLMALGKRGFIVNIARGAVVDERELLRCLVEGKIAGAGLDVFENEPHVHQELFNMDNVVLSPHWASFTDESCYSSYKLMLDNLEAFFSNNPLLSSVASG